RAGIEISERCACGLIEIVRSKILGRQKWQSSMPLSHEGCGCLTQVEEEGGQIGIACVHLVPDPRNAARIEPGGYERGLTGTRGRGQPYRRTPPTQAIKRGIQPLARDGSPYPRSRQLGKLWVEGCHVAGGNDGLGTLSAPAAPPAEAKSAAPGGAKPS